MPGVISSRTWGGGEERRCPICSVRSWIEPSMILGDAPCPCCGQLLWPVHRVRTVFALTGRPHARVSLQLGRKVRGAAIRIKSAVTALASRAKAKPDLEGAAPGGVWDPWLDA